VLLSSSWATAGGLHVCHVLLASHALTQATPRLRVGIVCCRKV
jgi:hypothetical protein